MESRGIILPCCGLRNQTGCFRNMSDILPSCTKQNTVKQITIRNSVSDEPSFKMTPPFS